MIDFKFLLLHCGPGGRYEFAGKLYKLKYVRVCLAIAACIALFFVLTILLLLTGVIDARGSSKNGLGAILTPLFIVAIVSIWRAIVLVEVKKPEATDYMPVLKKIASQERDRLESNRSNNQAELIHLEKRKAELEASMSGTTETELRAAAYQPHLDGKFWCPRCWIRDGAKNELGPSGSESSGNMKCIAPDCRYLFVAR